MTADYIDDASWLAHRLVEGGRAIRFVRVDRQAHRAATFLDDASLGAGLRRRDVSTAEIAAARVPAGPMHFVFHSAFACSTLLTRALDLPGLAMGLKEPAILNDMVALFRQGALHRNTLALVLALLGRPFAAGEAVVIKPSNVVNPLMPDMLRLRPQARALILYRPLPAFLRSVARKGMFGRIWARRTVEDLLPHAPFDAGFGPADRLRHTDLQAAAFGWLIQHAQFGALAAAFPGRVRVLAAPDFLADKAGALGAGAQWFGIDLPPALASQVATGAVFAEDAKSPGNRFALLESPAGHGAEDVVADEIAMVADWIGQVAAYCRIELGLGPGLLAAERKIT